MNRRKAVDEIFQAVDRGDIENANRLFRQAVEDAQTEPPKSELEPLIPAIVLIAMVIVVMLFMM